MFPPVRVNFSLKHDRTSQQQQPGTLASPTTNSFQQQQQLQLNSRDKYQVLMDILPYDSKRYRYAYHKSSWQQAGKADPPSPTKLFLHPDGPFTLEQLKRQVISFEKIKLTNNDANKHGYVSTSQKFSISVISFRRAGDTNRKLAAANLFSEARRTQIVRVRAGNLCPANPKQIWAAR